MNPKATKRGEKKCEASQQLGKGRKNTFTLFHNSLPMCTYTWQMRNHHFVQWQFLFERWWRLLWRYHGEKDRGALRQQTQRNGQFVQFLKNTGSLSR